MQNIYDNSISLLKIKLLQIRMEMWKGELDKSQVHLHLA